MLIICRRIHETQHFRTSLCPWCEDCQKPGSEDRFKKKIKLEKDKLKTLKIKWLGSEHLPLWLRFHLHINLKMKIQLNIS